ncbi:uncharacterized protein LOC129716796 [Wyeomyia smithii]|uniref:uncharacterized protein LOC129716796 n=1 Tax=Wyeomyia smithii TaxID=174621 RepID=UPI002467B2B5|nr:uncharacterized protein LOC129716796 [Wyeomyia smithii]
MLKKLIRERKSLEPRIKRVSDVVMKLEPEAAEEIDVQMEIETLNDIWASYCSVHKRILDVSEEDEMYNDAVDKQRNFEATYLALKGRLLKILKLVKNRDSREENHPQPQNDIIAQLASQQAEFFRIMSTRLNPVGIDATAPVEPHQLDAPNMPLSDLKLPRVNLPAFCGDYLEWQSFIDLFKSMVDQNPLLKDSQKLYFLKTNLSGEAASLISHLKIEDANYTLALEKLKSRYDKPLEIAHKHIQRFLNQPALTSSSAPGLRSLHDVSDEVVRALRAMEREDRDTWLIFILSEKFDPATRQLWYQRVADMQENEITLQCMLKFLDSRCFALQSAQTDKQRNAVLSKPQLKQPYKSTTFVATNSSSYCYICSKSAHMPFQCGKFIHMSPDERLAAINRHRLCRNCFKKHPGETCKSSNCRKCGLRHHTLLHAALEAPNFQHTPSTSFAASTGGNPAAQSLLSDLETNSPIDASSVLLATVAINVLDKKGRPHACRAVLDCASQVSFISESFCNELGLEMMDADMDLEGISSTPAHADKCVQIIIASRCTDYRTSVPCMVLERITKTLPAKPADIDGWSIPESIKLADPLFHRPGKINILIGNELFFQLLEPGKISLSSDDNLPTLQNTKFGWVVAGRYKNTTPARASASTCLIASVDDSLDQQLRRFWELEEYVPPTAHLSEEEKQCEDHFARHTVRNADGQFTVRLPFLHSPSQLGDSRQIAARRLEHIERKLQKNPHLKQEYHAFLREYIELGHMTRAESPATNHTVYLPHHCVIKEASSTTKCRVVFDASAKTTSGKSLNDVLMAGPVLQDSLINILLRFRIPAFVVAGDIKQMYRMVRIHDCDRDFQRILWRWSSSEPCILPGNEVCATAFECTSAAISSSGRKAEKGMYVDDVLTGADTEQEAVLLREQLSTIFASGGFHLRKWASNSAAVLKGVPVADREIEISIGISDEQVIKALGIHWQPCSDMFQFSYIRTKILQHTKRTILSQIASLFDPLGLLAPVIVKAKLVMQQMWELKVAWDETPPGELLDIWLKLVQSLSDLNFLQVPRRVIDSSGTLRMFLHGYSDASERAMGACIYLRVCYNDDRKSSHLLCAKSRIAPVGKGRTTLPRLELEAARILARLMANVQAALSLAFHEIRAFSDSTVALAWIKGGASRWKTFVANRVAEIVNHLPAINWYHVDTHSNPADLISRGALPAQISTNPLWWNGPIWNENSNIQHHDISDSLNAIQKRQVEKEQRVVAVACLTVYENQFLDKIMSRYYPNLMFLLCITARMLRFKYRDHRQSRRLTSHEIDRALHVYLQHVLNQHFWKEINQLNHGQDVSRSSCLHQLKPFLDENHLLRVGGRLQQSDLSYDTKHPILLPHKSILSSYILHHEHYEQLHCGPQMLLAGIRQRYWIIRGVSAARKVCRACVHCARARPASVRQQMGQLPADRVKPLPPFSITGIDYAGPINVIGRRTRGATIAKGYIALFVCFSTRAVHLEAVSDLSTSSFIAAFTRFISRYGLPNKVYSDNATNLRGAAKKFRDLYEHINATEHDDQVIDFFTTKGIEWLFTPARSPHHGGLWEAGIKVAKSFLSKLGGDNRFTFEELSTVLAQISACMNSRPISPLSNDPSEPQPLTPAHFLIGRPLHIIPEINQLDDKIDSLSRWQYVQRVTQEFRSRWQSEYVSLLQRMVKWQRSAPNIMVGDFVLLVSDNEKPKQWPMGRVVELFPGTDGIVRVVAVKTLNGISKRDVRRIRRIPLEADEYVPGRNCAEISSRNLVGGLCCGGI